MKYLLTIINLLALTLAFGQSDTLTIRDLRPAWISYSESGDLEGFQSGDLLAIFEVDLREDYSMLRIFSKGSIDVWINDQLSYPNHEGELLLGKSELPESRFMVSVYSELGINDSELETSLVTTTFSVDRTESSVRRIVRESDNYLLAITLLLLATGLYRTIFPVAFHRTFQIPLTVKLRSLNVEESYLSFFSIDNLFSISYFSFLMAIILEYLKLEPLKYFFREVEINAFVDFLFLLLVLSGLVIMKFIISGMLAKLFDFKEIANVQNQDFIHFFSLILVAMTVLSLIDFSMFDFSSEFIPGTIQIIFIATIFFFYVWLFLKLDKFFNHRKLMIIAYLCTTEFFPGFIIIKWLVD